eukprot:366159-Chlamydomonas_euryale.AAC.2
MDGYRHWCPLHGGVKCGRTLNPTAFFTRHSAKQPLVKAKSFLGSLDRMRHCHGRRREGDLLRGHTCVEAIDRDHGAVCERLACERLQQRALGAETIQE